MHLLIRHQLLFLHIIVIVRAKINFATLIIDRQTIKGETSGDDESDHGDAVAAFELWSTHVASWTGVPEIECSLFSGNYIRW